MSVTTGARLGPYEVVELLGEGGMGAVFRARDPRLGRDVAIKVLPAAFALDANRVRRFAQEARAVAALNHPNILTVYDVGEEPPYVVTELLEGETWRDVLGRRVPTTWQVLALAVQAAEGLAAAHAKGLVHRDLKPENLFLTTDGRVKVLDFGLAKQVDTGPSGTTTAADATEPGAIMGTLAYMAPEQIRAEHVDARADVFAFGVVLHEMLSGQHPFRRDSAAATAAAILHDTPPPLATDDPTLRVADAIVRRCLAKTRDHRWSDGQVLARVLQEALKGFSTGTALGIVEERSPYPGLRSFTERDAALFFGREDDVAALWTRIRARPLLAVIGPSGAGKTSFLRAGVLPARPDGWAVVVCTPGTTPLRALGQALAPQLTTNLEALQQLVAFDDPAVAFTVLRRWRQAHGHALVVIDQFEELFTNNAPEVQSQLAALLGRLVAEADIHVVLSLRDDFLMRCHRHEALGGVFSELTPLDELTRENLRRALVEPARTLGYRFDDEALVDEMIDCVEGARAALPMLAFTVARLWDGRDRDRNVLTRAAYEQIGGVAGALAQHAEATLERIGSVQQEVVRELFRNLVTAQGTRAVTDRDELLSAFPSRAEAEGVLHELVDARLLTSYEVKGHAGEPDRQRIEIAHESLLRAWPRLVRWQTQDEDGAQLRDQLKQAAHLWQEKGRSADLLWTGTAFQECALWRERYPGSLTALEEDFAGAMSDRAKRQKTIRRAVTVGAFAVLIAVAVVIGISRQQAVTSARKAEASKLLALAELRFVEDPTEAEALAAASLEQADTKEARLFVMKALWEAPLAIQLDAHDTKVVWPAFSPDGHMLAAAGFGPNAYVWTDDGRRWPVLGSHEMTGASSNVARWASNDLLVTGLFGGGNRLQVWAAPKGERLKIIDLRTPIADWSVTERRLLAKQDDPNGDDIVLTSSTLPNGPAIKLASFRWAPLAAKWSAFAPDGSAWLYLTAREIFARPLPQGSGPDVLLGTLGADLASFGPHVARRFVVGDKAGAMLEWEFRPGQAPVSRTYSQPAGSSHNLEIDSSGRWLFDVGDVRVRAWPVARWPGTRPIDLRRSGAWALARADVHPSGNWLAACQYAEGRLSFWPLSRPRAVVADGYREFTRPVVFSPDGRWLATTWSDRRIRLWPLPGNETAAVLVPELPAGPERYFPVTFDSTSRMLLVKRFGDGWAMLLIPLDGGPAEHIPVGPFGFATNLPSGRYVAAGPDYGQGEKTLQVWDRKTGKGRRFVLPGRPGDATGSERDVRALAFADDSTLYTAGDGGIRRWNVDTGQHELVRADGGQQLDASFNRDASVAVVTTTPFGSPAGVGRSLDVALLQLRTGTSVPLPSFAAFDGGAAIDPSGRVVAVADSTGSIGVGRTDGSGGHLLVGHKGPIDWMAISPDLRWVASAGGDNTLRLWPMPDLSEPPLHTLPLDQLLAKLHSLTNLRAVRDPGSSTGWKIEVGPFPGWKNVPTW